MIASTVPTWLAVLSGVIGAFAGALGAFASLLMSVVNYKRLNAIHTDVKATLVSMRAPR